LARKTIVHRFFEKVFNQQSQAADRQIIDRGLVVHHPMLPVARVAFRTPCRC